MPLLALKYLQQHSLGLTSAYLIDEFIQHTCLSRRHTLVVESINCWPRWIRSPIFSGPPRRPEPRKRTMPVRLTVEVISIAAYVHGSEVRLIPW